MSKVTRGMKRLGVFWLTCLVACTSPTSTHSKDFVARNGTHLVLDGKPYRFTGLNIYNANSINNCWYTLGTGSARSAGGARRRGKRIRRRSGARGSRITGRLALVRH